LREKKETLVLGEKGLQVGDVVRLSREGRAQLRMGQARIRFLPGSEFLIRKAVRSKSRAELDFRVGVLEFESEKPMGLRVDQARVSVEVARGVLLVEQSGFVRLSVVSGVARVRLSSGETVVLKAGDVARLSSGVLDGVPESAGLEQVRAYWKGLGF
jgi:hypothetical protein